MRMYELIDSHGFRFIGIPRENGALSFNTKQDAEDRAEECFSLLGYSLTVVEGRDHPDYSP